MNESQTSKLLSRLRERLIVVPKPGTEPFVPGQPFWVNVTIGGLHDPGESAGLQYLPCPSGGVQRVQEHVYEIEPLCKEAADEIERLTALLARDKTNAVHRLHNLCDALHEQAGESPFSREAWEQADAAIATANREVERLRAAIGQARALFKAVPGNGISDNLLGRIAAWQGMFPEIPADETTSVPQEPFMYACCEKHKGMSWSMTIKVSTVPPRTVCPICHPPEPQ